MISTEKYKKIKKIAEYIEENCLDKESYYKIITSVWGAPGNNSIHNPKWKCRFHDDHSPSFVINGNKTCGCWSCNTYFLNIISFVMKAKNISFIPATLYAARVLEVLPEEELNKIDSSKNNRRNYRNEQIEEVNIDNILTSNSSSKNEKKYPYPNKNTLNIVYSMFSKGNTLIGKLKLNQKHLDELINVRKLTLEEIEEIGFFSYPSNEIIKPLIDKLKENGCSENILQYVPGFYYSKKQKQWTFKPLPQNIDGYCIPIKGANKRIIAIQIRTNMKNKKYIWFSSSFAKHFYNDKFVDVLGNSPGTPISVVFPKQLKGNMIFITEGFYKAYAISQKYNCIALSMQGVYNASNIKQIIDGFKHYIGTKNIFIAFDADMAEKVQVLKAALRIGLIVSGVDLGPLKQSWDSICAHNSKDRKIPIRECVNDAVQIRDMLLNTDININYCIWDSNLGKGMDDAIENNVPVRKISFQDFWKYSFNVLSHVDIYETQTGSVVNQEKMRELFEKFVMTKIYSQG